MPAAIRPPLREVRSRLFDSARWAAYSPRPDDVIVATYPKCGTTWMRRIVSMLLAASPVPAPLGGFWFDMRLARPLDAVVADAETMPTPRKGYTHMPYDALPVYEGVRFIHVARDGRDAALSLHNHLLAFTPAMLASIDAISRADHRFGDPMPPTPADPAEYFRLWLTDGGGIGDPGASFFHVARSYWAARAQANMLLVHYADLKADCSAEIARVARFLEIDLPQATLDEITQAAGFEAMREVGDALIPGADRVWDGGMQRFLFKGVNGRWKDVLTDDDLAAYDAKVRAEFTPALAAWLERGRLGTSDPAQV
jgi:aryl sulfotransferase